MNEKQKLIDKCDNFQEPTDLEVFIAIFGQEAEAEELAALKAQLQEAREIIEMIDGATSQDEIEATKSMAYEFLNEYPNA